MQESFFTKTFYLLVSKVNTIIAQSTFAHVDILRYKINSRKRNLAQNCANPKRSARLPTRRTVLENLIQRQRLYKWNNAL